MLIVLGSLLLVGRSRVESAAGTGVVELAFTGTLTAPNAVPIAKLYQRVALNVLSVRLNPSADLTISDSDPFWVEIPAPAEIGLTNPTEFITTSLNFGGTGTLLTAATSILQLDLMPLQNVPFFSIAQLFLRKATTRLSWSSIRTIRAVLYRSAHSQRLPAKVALVT